MSSEENSPQEESTDESETKKEQTSSPPKKRKTEKARDNKKEKPKKAKRRKPSHPKTLDMITEAIEVLEDSKGSSVQAIRSFILDHYKVRPDMIKAMMRRALATGLKDEVLARPKGQAENKQTLSGRYMIKVKKASEEDPSPVRTRPPSLRQPKAPKKPKAKKKRKRGFY